MTITAEELRKIVSYNRETGIMTRTTKIRGRGAIGDEIGSSSYSGGYRKACINGKLYYVHRLAWLYVHGTWPNGFIDHINRVVTDNRLSNLRECTREQNQMNRGPQKETKTGFKNVYLTKGGTYFCSIRANGVTYNKNFVYKDDAVEWVETKRKEVHGAFSSS